MRRCAVLLSLLLAVWAVPAAHADPVCLRVGTTGDPLPDPLLAPFCVGYDGPVYCGRERFGVDPGPGFDVTACVPGS